MKKTFFITMAMCLTSVFCVSCGDDNTVVSPAPAPSVMSGKLSSISLEGGSWNFEYTYDANGRLASIWDYPVTWENANVMQYSFNDEDDERKETDEYEVTLNADGLVSSIYNYYKYEYSSSSQHAGEWEEATTQTTFAYNSNKQLIKIEVSGDGNESYDNELETSSWNTTMNFTWNNGLLMGWQSRDEDKYMDEGTLVTEVEQERAEISYDTQKNSTLQYPYCLADDLCEGTFIEPDYLFVLGMMGVGPINLPNMYKRIEIKEDETEIEDEIVNLSYTLNSDGSIRTERESLYGGRYNQTYNYTYGATRSTSVKSPFSLKNQKQKSRRRAFHKHNERL